MRAAAEVLAERAGLARQLAAFGGNLNAMVNGARLAAAGDAGLGDQISLRRSPRAMHATLAAMGRKLLQPVLGEAAPEQPPADPRGIVTLEVSGRNDMASQDDEMTSEPATYPGYRQIGRGRLQDGFAGPAGVARPDVADHLQPRRHLLQHLGHVLPEPGQAGRVGAAAAAGEDGLVQDCLARQVRGQRAAQRRPQRLVRLALRPACLLRRRLALRLVLLEVADQHLELADLGGEPLGGLAVAVAPQRRELDLELFDLEPGVQQQRVTLGQRGIALGKGSVSASSGGTAGSSMAATRESSPIAPPSCRSIGLVCHRPAQYRTSPSP
jgi:hypothetical protein